MSKGKQKFVIKKGEVYAKATDITLPGLEKRGWTVVDDGDKDQAESAATEDDGGQEALPFDSDEER